ncbi:hypothetical protein [Rhodococcus ruber]|uniref:hypothetical protein n=1 Tax=Rhodococcus ruber TaxID=1830 RepID=UPI00265E867F|nr:hypothetical protein [Rhodococcus ruber]
MNSPNTSQHERAALDSAHPDLMPLARQWIADLPAGATFTAAQMGTNLPPYADDKPCRRGAVIRELNRRGLIEFAGYGPRAAEDDWDAPARVWRRTGKPARDRGAA